MDGVLVVDKPAGMTSHDVVAKVRRILKTKKVGHGGTLDPDATGVLVLGIGRATRFLSYAQAAPKRYLAGVRFGITTTTLDSSGDVLEERDAVNISEDEVSEKLTGFMGQIEQVPPMVSAVKIGGERLYKKARRGEDVDRPPRPVTIYELQLKRFDSSSALAELDVTCSGGTYIRTLAADLGEELGCGAHLATLQRLSAGGFHLAEAVSLEQVTPECLLPLAEIVRGLSKIDVTEEEEESVLHGRPLPLRDGIADSRVAVMSSERLLAVYSEKDGRLVPERVVSH